MSWEDEFDVIFPHKAFYDLERNYYEDVKAFIRETIAQEKQALVEEIKKWYGDWEDSGLMVKLINHLSTPDARKSECEHKRTMGIDGTDKEPMGIMCLDCGKILSNPTPSEGDK